MWDYVSCILDMYLADVFYKSDEYQAKLDQFVLKTASKGQTAVIRSRREVVQHAAALQYIVERFVRQGLPMGEKLGFDSSKPFGGTYRHGNEQAYAGSRQYPKAIAVPEAMKSMIESRERDLAEVERTG